MFCFLSVCVFVVGECVYAKKVFGFKRERDKPERKFIKNVQKGVFI